MVALFLSLVMALAQVEVLQTGPAGGGLETGTRFDWNGDTIPVQRTEAGHVPSRSCPFAPARNALGALPEYFNRAESTIDIAEMYMLYYPPDSKGSAVYPLYDGLIAAAQRGVRVRILLDSTTLEGNTSETYQRMRRSLFAVPGIEVRACDLRPHSRYPDCMLHAKYLVIDGRVAVIGSHNWSFAGFTDNVELSLALDDSAVAGQLAQVFEQDWRVAVHDRIVRESPDGKGDTIRIAQAQFGHVPSRPSPAQSPRFRLVVTAPERLRDTTLLSTEDGLRQVFAAADSTLDIIVNSISTRVDFGAGRRYSLVDSLVRDADARGVSVRLLVDNWALEHDAPLLRSLDTLPHVEVRVADIAAIGPNPKTGSVHAKVVIADGRTILLGSATFSQRQLQECRNVGVFVTDPAVGATLEDLFARNWFSVFTRRP